MIPLAALEILRRWWPALLVLALVAVGAVAGLRLVALGGDLARAQAEAADLRAQVERAERNAVEVAEVLAAVDRCRADVADAQAAADRWRVAYQAAERRPPRVVEVPVTVAAPGTPCDQAAVELAVWLAAEVPR